MVEVGFRAAFLSRLSSPSPRVLYERGRTARVAWPDSGVLHKTASDCAHVSSSLCARDNRESNRGRRVADLEMFIRINAEAVHRRELS